MANHGPSYGLSREIEIKTLARLDVDEAVEVLEWVELVTGRPLAVAPQQCTAAHHVALALRDGVALCMLMNRIMGRERAVRYNASATMPFHKMENISNFLEAVKAYGVPEISCFQTVDLYENKQTYKVIECLRALAAVARSKEAPVDFPAWVVRLAQPKPRAFQDAVLRKGEMVIPLQYGTNKCASQKGMTPYGLARQIKPDDA